MSLFVAYLGAIRDQIDGTYRVKRTCLAKMSMLAA